jgi:hypothetical protein
MQDDIRGAKGSSTPAKIRTPADGADERSKTTFLPPVLDYDEKVGYIF